MALVALAVSPVSLHAEPTGRVDTDRPVVAFHPVLRDSLERIAGASRLWRDALDTLAGTGRRAVVVTPEQVRVHRGDGSGLTAFEPDVLAEVTPLPVSGSEVRTVLIVINLPLLHRAHYGQMSSTPFDLQRDLDRIVIHEVYGHAFPYLLAGDMSGRCADAAPGQRAGNACAIQRENAVRAELGLGRRDDAGVDGLDLPRRLARGLTAPLGRPR